MKTTKATIVSLRTNRKNRKSILRRGILATSAAALLGISILGGTAGAATQFWDNNGTGAGVGFQGASGVWDVATTSNWSPDNGGATTSQTWANGNDAIFQGTTGTVVLSAGVSALSVTLSTAYTLNGATLTLTGGANALTSTLGGTFGAGLNITTAAGTITSNGGTLNLNGVLNAGALGLTFAGAGATTLTQAITNTTTLTKNGIGTLTLAGNNGFTSATINAGTIAGGTLTLSAGGTSLLATATSAVNSNVTFNFAGTSAIQINAGTLSLGGTVAAGSQPLLFQGAGSATLTNAITGGTALTMSAGGTLTLAGTNTFGTGVTITTGSITGGTLSVTGANAITGNSAGAVGISSAIVGAGSTTITNSNVGVLTLSGGVTGAANLVLANNGATASGIVLSTAAVNNAGTITNNGAGGSVSISAAVGSNVTTITENSATSALDVSGQLSISSGGTTQITNSNAALLTLSGGVTGTGALILSNTGNTANGITLSGAAVNHTGLISNNGAGNGSVLISAAVGSNVNNITENTGTSALNVTGALTVNAAGTTLVSGSNNNAVLLTLSGGVTGTGNLVLSNNGSAVNGITLSTAAVNNTGTITNNGAGTGSVLISAPVGSNVTGITENSAASALSVTGALTVGATTTLINSNTALLTLSGGVGGTGNLVLQNNSTTASGITLSTAAVNNTGTITNSGTGTGSALISSVIGANVTTVTQNGASTLVISNAGNAYTGNTTITAGILRTGAANVIPNGAGKGNVNFTAATGTLDLNTFSQAINGLVGGAGTTVDTIAGGTPTLTLGNNNATAAFGGVIQNTAGTLALTKVGTGTQTLTGANTYSGVTTINGAAPIITGSVGPFSTLSVSTLAAGGVASGIGNSSNAAGNLVLNGGNLQYTGGTVTTDRLFTLGANGGMISNNGTGAVTFSNTGLMAFAGGNDIARTLTLTGTSTVGINVMSLQINDGPIAAGTAITTVNIPAGGSTWLLTNNLNGFGGLTTVFAGQTLQLGAAGVLGGGGNAANGTVVNTGGTLQMGSSNGAPALTNGITVATEFLTLNGNGVANAGALTVNPGAGFTDTWSGPITIGSSNTSIKVPGGTALAGGAGGTTLNLNGGVNKTAVVLTFTGGGTININPGGATPGIFSTAGGFNSDLVLDGTGLGGVGPGVGKTVLNLNVANTYPGPTWITNGGIINANVANALPTAVARTTVTMDPTAAITGSVAASPSTGSSVLNLNGGFSQAVQSLTSPNTAAGLSSVVNLNGNTLTIGNANAADVQFFYGRVGTSPALDLGGIIKDGVSTQVFAGNTENYIGGTIIQAGHLQIGDGTTGNLHGASAVTVNPGAFLDLKLGNGVNFANGVTNNGTVEGINTANSQNVTGVIQGIGNFVQGLNGATPTAGGTTVFQNVMTYQGGTRITGAGSNLTIGTATTAATAGANSGVAATAVVVDSGGTFQLVNVQGGILFNNITNNTAATTGTVLRTGSIQATLTGTITNGAGSIAVTNNGTGTLILANSADTTATAYTGTTISTGGGTLQIGTSAATGAIGAASVVTVGDAAAANTTFAIVNPAGNAVTNAITNGIGNLGTVLVTPANLVTITLSGVLSNGAAGTLALTQNGSGTTVLTAADTFTGATNVSAGTLQVGTGAIAANAGNLTATSGVTVASNATLAIGLVNAGNFAPAVNLNGANAQLNMIQVAGNANTVGGVISGAGIFNQNGAGATTLTATDTYTGATNVNAGTLTITGNLTGTSGVAVANNTIFQTNLANNAIFDRNVSLNGANAVMNAIQGGTNTLAGVISGTGIFNATGAGTTNVTNTDTYTGATTVSGGGTLAVGNGATGNLTGTSGVTVSGTSILVTNLVNNGVFNAGVALTAATDVMTANQAGTNTLNGAITGLGIFNQAGAGLTILTATDSYTGATNVNAGTLQVGNGATGNLTGTSGVAVANNATLATNLVNNGTFNRAVALNGANANLNAIQAGTNTLSGAITGTGALNQTGTGITILTSGAAANNYSGGTKISSGTLQLGAATAGIIGTGAVNLGTGGTLSVVNIGAAATNVLNNNITNNLGGLGNVNVNSATVVQLAGAIKDGAGGGTLQVTQSNAAGFTILTGANTYTGGTTVAAGTLSVGNASVSAGANALATAGTGLVTVNAGAKLFVDLLNGETFANNVLNNGNVSTASNGATTQTISGNITGAGTFTHDPKGNGGTTILTGANSYTGATTVGNAAVASTLTLNGSLTTSPITVTNLSTLNGSGTSAGNVTVNNGGNIGGTLTFTAGTATVLAGGSLTPGNSPGTLTFNNLVLNTGSILNFQFGNQQGVVGQTVAPGNDLIQVNGNLTLNGTLNVLPVAVGNTVAAGSYRIINYNGGLINNILGDAPDAITGIPAGFTPVVVTSVPGQVNLLVLNNAAGPAQNWDGGPGAVAGDGTATGGNGTWNNFTTNWTNATPPPAGINTAISGWQNGTAIFGAPNGIVTINDTVNAQGLIFANTGYVINSQGTNTLNMIGQNPASTAVPSISVTNAGDVATINAQITNTVAGFPVFSNGLTSTGAGTLVLTNVGNTYTGGTTITGGGAVSIVNDAVLGAVGTLTLGNAGSSGTLQVTQTMTLNAARGITLAAGGGGIDTVGIGTQLTYGGVITGAGSLTKIGTGTLLLTGLNTYTGATIINAGTVSVATINNGGVAGNLGAATNAAANLVLGGGTLQYTGATASTDRAFTLTNATTSTIDVTSALTALKISGSAAASTGALTKVGAGTLILTGANAYTGTTTINAGTLQVGDGATNNAKIGNNLAASQVLVNNGTTLDVQLTNTGNTFNNNIVTAGNGAVKSTTAAGVTQTLGGIISGTGTVDVFGLGGVTSGVTILSGVNTYTGITTVNQGTLRLNNAAALGAVGGLASGTVVVSGATLDLFGQTVGSEELSISGAGVGGNGALINSSVAAPASLAGLVHLQGDTTITTTTANNNLNNNSTTIGSITLTGNIDGGFKLIKNGTGLVILTGVNNYGDRTNVNGGILQIGNNDALGSLNSGTFVIAGASLQLQTGLLVKAEPLDIQGFGAPRVAPVGGLNTLGALTQVQGAISTYTGAINVSANASISANGGILTLTGGITKNGTTLTLNGGGTINVNTVGIFGAAINSDLVVDGTGVGGATVVNLNVANPYNGPTWITNGGTINALVLGALPSTAADGLGGVATNRTAVTMDPVAAIAGSNAPAPSTGGSILNLGASQAIQSLTSPTVTSQVNLATNTLTIGTAGGTTTFAGIISGAGNAVTGSIIKDGTSTQIFSGPNTYTGATTVKGGTLRAGIITNAFGNNSAVSVNAGGTLELAGFSNTIGSLASTPLPGGGVVQNTAVGNNAPATLTISGVNAAGAANAVNFGGTIVDTGAAANALSIVKNGAGTQIFSGANTYIGTTTVNAGVLQAGIVTTTVAGVPVSGAFGVDSKTTVNAGGTLELAGFSNTVGTLSGGGALSFVQNTLNNNIANLTGVATLTIDGTNAAGAGTAVTYGNAAGGVIKDTAGTALSIVKNGLGTQIFGGANTYIGTTTVNGGILQAGIVTQAFGNNSAVTVAAAGTLDLAGFSNTIGSLTGAVGGIVQSTGGTATLTTGGLNTSTDYAGVLQNGVGGTLLLTKVGTGIQTLSGTAANTYTGLTTVNAGELDLNKTAGINAIGGNLTIGDGVGPLVVPTANSDIVKLLAANQIIPTSLVLINGTTGKLDLNNNNQTIGSLADIGTITTNGSSVTLGTGTLTTGAGGGANPANPSTTFSGIVSGAGNALTGALIKQGTGTFTLAGLNTYTGATRVNAGTLKAGVATVPAPVVPGDLNVKGAFGNNSAVIMANTAGAILDITGFNTQIGSITGGGTTGGNVTLGAATLTVGGDGTSPAAYAGIISGTGGLTKIGGGTQILSGVNTFSGPTTVNTGTLSLANAAGTTLADTSAVTVTSPGTLNLGTNETIASLAGTGAVTLNAQTLTTGVNNSSTTFSGIISSGALGALVKQGTGTFTVSGANTYTGGTTVSAGTLAAGNTKALGSGNLTVNNGGTFRTSGGPLVVNIGGGIVQINTGGTVIANVGGTTPGVTHDQLLTTGNVGAIGGKLALVQTGGYLLAPGDKVNLVSAGSVTGGTAVGTAVPAANITGLAAFSVTPLLVPTVNLYLKTVTLEAMQGSFAGLNGQTFDGTGLTTKGKFVMTPNQLAVARGLDSVAKTVNFKTGVFKEFNFLDTQSLSTLQSNLDKIAPEELTAIFTASFSLANIQSANLQRRMEDIRNQATSPFEAGVAGSGNNTVYAGGAHGPRGHRSKEIAPASEDKWGMFLTGSGEFTRVGSTTNAAGYNLESGGITAGIDYRVNNHLAIGLNLGYIGTTASLANGGKLDNDGGRLGLFATYFDQGFHADVAVNGGLNSYNTRRTTPNNTAATGSPGGSEINVLVAAGYDWKFGGLTVGPTASYQYTNVSMDGFTEVGPFAPLNVRGQSADSSRTSLGIRASYDAHIGRMVIRPEARLAWQHEFGSTGQSITSSFATLGGTPFSVSGPSIGRDSLLASAGFTLLFNDRMAFYVYYDGELGRQNFDSHNVSGGFRLQF